MQLTPHVTAIQTDLASAAMLGDEATARAAQKLADALASSLQLRLLELLGEAALDVTAQLPAGHVEVRLVGREPQLVLVGEPQEAAAEPQAPADDASARITLRLSEGLKAGIEGAADREQISTNAWIVKSLARALDTRPPRFRTGNRLQGFAHS
jgi:hypothetical protein